MNPSNPFKRIKTIRCTDPELTPENWCEVQPCRMYKFGKKEIIITQPASSVLVYLLGLLTIGLGAWFLWSPEDQVSRLWWGISLLLWGIGALLAGTSYQAFGYQIKCAGQSRCSWTSWWEVVYLMLQQLSLDALLIAVAYSSTEGNLQTILLVCALIVAVGYLILTFWGALIPKKSLITFERMLWVSAPLVITVLGINTWGYYISSSTLELGLAVAWVFLLIIISAYWLYDHYDITHKLWEKGEGIWFSQNDLLHLGLILWMIYIAGVVAQHISDFTCQCGG